MLTLDWIGNFGYSVLRLSTPLIFAGMAAVISKKAGMMNMALEGMMLCAALGGVVFAGMTGNVWIGLLGAVVIGVLVGAVIAFSSLSGKTDLYLTCIAVNLAATGGTVFVMYLLTGEKATTSAAIKAYTLPTVVLPLINKIPLIGPMLSGHNVLTYLAFISIFAVWFFLTRTRLGCGFGGAFMSMGWVSFFMKNMVNGRGYIGLSACNIAGGDPLGAGIAAVFFGLSDAAATSLKSQTSFPTEFLEMIPYAATIIALMVFGMLRMNRQRKIEKGSQK